MEIFKVFITKIHKIIKKGNHVVLVDCDTDCYGKIEHNHIVFQNYQWKRIKSQMSYMENEGNSEDAFKYYESLSDEEYHKRFERTLNEFTDAELITELNKRTNSIFHNIKFEVKAVVGNH